MLKRSITYVDFNDQQRTEDFYFNLSKAEVMEFEIRNSLKGGMDSLMKEVIAAQDGNRIMDIFKDIIGRAYGVKGSDGRSFIKNKELTDGFMGSEAYSELFMELMYDPDKAALFIQGILPQNVVGPQGVSSNPGPQQPQRPPTQDYQQKQPITRHVPEMPHVAQQPVQNQPERPYIAEPQRPTVDVPLPDPYQQTRPAHEQVTQPLPQEWTHDPNRGLPHQPGEPLTADQFRQPIDPQNP